MKHHQKEDFYSYLNIEDITGAEYTHSKRVWKDFEIKKLEDYHDSRVQSDTLLLADVFEKFQNMFLETHEIDPVHFHFSH